MSAKRTKASRTSNDIDELFEGLGDEPVSASSASVPTETAKGNKNGKPRPHFTKSTTDKDILADLENELSTQVPVRPNSPRINSVVKNSKTEQRRSLETSRLSTTVKPQTSSDEPSSSREALLADQSSKEPTTAIDEPDGSASNNWWGGIFASATATATAAIKQAETVVKEIQQSEDARKIAEQVRGNVGVLKGLSDELRHRAMPTFTNIIHTLAPPISSHEQLLIHITHDFIGYPSMDAMIYEVFSRVMSQVEGGDLLVFQRGSEKACRGSNAGWRDGPWWRQNDGPRDISLVKGLVEGTKLCRVNAESFASEHFTHQGGLEEARNRATISRSESNPVRTSDIFLALQAIAVHNDSSLFSPPSSLASDSHTENSRSDERVSADTEDSEEIVFAIYLYDPIHEIHYSSLTQAIPQHWLRWLDSTDSSDDASKQIPPELQDIINNSGLDPREWIVEWLEEVLALGVGVVAQRYVAKRMGLTSYTKPISSGI